MSDKLHIIHGGRAERLALLYKELNEQRIADFEIWDGVHDSTSTTKSINLSHKQIVRYAKLAELDSVVIAEDDVKFCDKGAWDYFLQRTPLAYDIFLSGIYLGQMRSDYTVHSFSGLHLYRVHKDFYDTFLSVPDDVHIDRGLTGLGVFEVCYPFAAIQYNGFSQNTKKEENYDNLLQGRSFYKKT